ncbi:STAS domain-containing protein [Amycolatopsis sp. NPDC058278]|uniref:STAS domain-containing protein n=1 Tax=unclassified Amycolatopsis TaxID=2618356 RepID=UPI00255B855B|nr:STAS domain-containing protein [Amycolatopsis sp. DG1A-15b]WIX90029.1 STAS domain-containing protein [Amycolatopsis sp. DG1A-15b]
MLVVQPPATAIPVAPSKREQRTAFDIQVIRPYFGAVMVRIRGALDADSAPQVRSALSTWAHRRFPVLVLDLSEVDFLDAAGLAALGGIQARVVRENATLRIVTGDNRVVRRALSASGLDHALNVSRLPSGWERATEIPSQS